MSSKNVVFDVVGTLVSYDRVFAALDHRLGDRLRAEGIKPRLLGYTWMEAAEREYTYLSISNKYVPFADCFRAIFYRMLWQAGIAEPRAFASPEDLVHIMDEYQYLEMRPGAVECVKRLRDAGFSVWAFTAGDLKRVGGYFQHAGIDLPPENLLSCDSRGVGKPDPAAYKPLLDKLIAENDGKKPWFAAAHMWDVSAARRTGCVYSLLVPAFFSFYVANYGMSRFKGAYCTVWEKEPLQDLFGDMDVIDDTLPGMADKIISRQASS
jgi:2-haloacid dehalogenase